MKKLFLLIILIVFHINLFAQDLTNYEKPPVFPECDSVQIQQTKLCFNNKLYQFISENFKTPQNVIDENYKGEVAVLFEVNKKGIFNVLFVDAMYNELKDEVKKVFSELPQVIPATYNGNPTYAKYSISIKIPLVDQTSGSNAYVAQESVETINPVKKEIDNLNESLKTFEDLEYSSGLNIPFTHSFYSVFDQKINLIGTNNHTASKPYRYSEVAPYYDLKERRDKMIKGSGSWWNRKLFNEHLVKLQGKDYWFTVNPIFDLSVGEDTDADFNSTFNNTRGIMFQGGIGKKLNFYTSVFESQGRFAQYYNQYAESIGKPSSDTEVGIVPGRGIAKRFKDDAYDYPVAEAYLSFTPSKFMNIQFGHAKNFIGDGYRSLLLSDVASPHTFFKLNTNFWKIQYTNTWMWLRDVRPEVQEDGAFLTKYMANHYLSLNVSKRLNIGLFESVLWVDSNGRGFDINYLNPVIFYRAIEFESGQDAGNAVLGATAKYKWNDNLNFYGQFILDEFSLEDIRDGNKSYKNKFGYQIGAKYYNAFKVNNLMLQIEYNQVRPYTYSHPSIVLNYGHSNQSMAHLWGSNFKEVVLIGRYNYKRWFGDAKIIIGKRGFDFNTSEDDGNYGGDIYKDYFERISDVNNEIGQGNTTDSFYLEFEAGYLVNPTTNLKLFLNLKNRNFVPDVDTATTFDNSTVWFNLGIRTELFNWYFDQ
ncbi:MAG: gliding motility protein RemB [Flavobacteriaceae bacterium]|nr:gliding motility protein RemB [Bacteroidia bacterium]NNL16987.1 gliding motility protein RemB [Flavobacteriaceae bacterium]